MRTIPQVTLCCVDARNHQLALRALERCRHDLAFARTILLTDHIPANIDIPAGIDVIASGPIESHDAYSKIILKDLYGHIGTSHVLIIQWDGYIVHPETWTDDFLDCDYIGAPWPDAHGRYCVGNGGFSLRSRRLLEALQDDRFSFRTDAEDVTICGLHRSSLESQYGIRFGSVELARRFSYEMGPLPIGETLGFHGVFNLIHFESEHEIAALASMLSDSLARSEMVLLLLRNLLIVGQFVAALALGERMLAADPENDEAADAVVRSRCAIAGENRVMSNSRSRTLVSQILKRFRSRR